MYIKIMQYTTLVLIDKTSMVFPYMGEMSIV